MSRRGLVVVTAIALAIAAFVGWSVMRPGARTPRDRGAVASGGGSSTRDRAARSVIGARPHAWLAQPDARGRRVAGRVVSSGQPVAGATVTLASRASDAGLVPPRRVTSGADGAFDFGAQDAAPVTVAAEADGKTGAMVRVDLRDPSARPPADALVIELRPCTASVFGNVLDAAGGAIPGATVRRGPIEAVAGADGAYTLCVPVGDATLEVGGDGYGAITATLAVSARLRRDFQLSPEGVLTGRAVRADDGSPVGGALVSVAVSGERFPGMAASGGAAAKAATDDHGRFRIAGLLPGRRQVSATAAGLRATSIDVLVEAGEAREDVELALGTTTTMSGIVLDERGKPVEGASVALSDPDQGWRRLGEELTAVSQGDGAFVVDGVPPGDYDVAVYPYRRVDRARPPALNVPAGGVDGVELVVTRGSTISGVVTRGGRPIGGARVYVRGRGSEQSVSEIDGRFRLRAIEPGDHRLYAESIQDGAFTNGPVVRVNAGNDVTGVTLELDLAGAISGVVVDQRGAPVAGAYLSVRLVKGNDFGEATTADDGSFAIGALSGGGEYAVTIRASKQSSLRYQPVSGGEHPRVPVADGSSRVEGLRFAVKVDRLQISGRVVDDRGQALPDVTVEAHPEGERGFAMGALPSAVSDADGHFLISDLVAGGYYLAARAGNGAEALPAAPVDAGTRDARLVLAAPGEIEGTLTGFNSPPRIEARRRDFSPRALRMGALTAEVRGNSFRIRGVPPGQWSIMALSGGVMADEETIEVEPQRTAEVTFEYRGAGSIGGVLVDENDAPVDGAFCFAMGARNTRDATDAQGRFTIDPASVGPSFVMCQTRDDRRGHARLTVEAGKRSTVKVTLEPTPTGPE